MSYEEWREVKSYEGVYQVSNLGRVRSCARIIPRVRNGKVSSCYVKERILRSYRGTYPMVRLGGKHDGVLYSIPHLVLQAFDTLYDGEHFYHINFDTTDNRLDNLRSGVRTLGAEWKVVPNTKGLLWASTQGKLYYRTHTYQSNGRVYVAVERFLSYSVDRYGYDYISCKEFPQLHFVHGIIAMTFIPNPDNKPTVNHKDGNKHNNSVDNLEWATMQEQTDHAFDTNLRSLNVEIEKCRKMTEKNSQKVICINDGVIYPSIKNAAQSVGISAEGLRRSIIDGRALSNGLRFERYVE